MIKIHKIIFIPLLILSSLSLCENTTVDIISDPSADVKVQSNEIDHTSIIQDFLDSGESDPPDGIFNISETLVWSKQSYINWGGTILKPTKNIDVLKIDVANIYKGSFDCHNLTINGESVKNPTKDKAFITVMHNKSYVQYYTFRDIKMFGNQDGVFHTKDGGNIGITFDFTTPINGTLKTTKMGENHWGVFDNIVAVGLHTGLNLQKVVGKDTVPNSRHEIFMQGSRNKYLASIGAGRINMHFKYNGSTSLVESEQNYGVVKLTETASWNTISAEFPDFNKGNKVHKNWNGKKSYAHKFIVSDKGRHNSIKADLGTIKKK